MKLIEWVAERAENASQIAAEKRGKDRDGWLEDERAFTEILDALCRLQAIEGKELVFREGSAENE